MNSCLPCVSTVPVEPNCRSLLALFLLVAFLSNTHIFSQCHSKHLQTLKIECKVKAGFLSSVIPTLHTGRNSHPVCKLFHSHFSLAVLRRVCLERGLQSFHFRVSFGGRSGSWWSHKRARSRVRKSC